MKKLVKNYLVKLVGDPTRKPRLYQSEDNLEYGDRVITYNLRADVPLVSENAMYKRVDGYVLGTIECSKNTTKKLVELLGGYYPLAKCEKYQPRIVDREDYSETTFYRDGNEPIMIIREYKNGVERVFDVRK